MHSPIRSFLHGGLPSIRHALARLQRMLIPLAALIAIAPTTGRAQYVLEQIAKGSGTLRFLNAGEAFSFTDNTISYSSDSGNTWRVITPDVRAITGSITIADLRFVDRSTGWMITYNAPSIYVPIDSSFIYATTDGGATWKLQRASVVSSMKWASQTFRALRFVDAKHGWAMGLGVIEHTSDGGATWTTQLRWSERAIYNDLFTSGYFRDENEGWIAGYGSFILHTSDGGETWATQHVDSATTPEGAELHPDTYCLFDIHFADSLHGYAPTEHGNYLYTRDGGVSWIHGHTGRPNDNVAVYALDEDRVWMVGGNYCDDKGCYAGQSVLYSNDGGDTWNEVVASKLGYINDVDEYLSVHFVNPRLGYISNGYGNIFRLRDTSRVAAGVDVVTGGSAAASIAPNPVREALTIMFADGSSERSVAIYDAMGRRLSSTEAGRNGSTVIVTSDLPPGEYMVEIHAGTSVERRKIVVMR